MQDRGSKVKQPGLQPPMFLKPRGKEQSRIYKMLTTRLSEQ